MYDAADNVLQLIDGKNQTNFFAYDLHGRLTNQMDTSGNIVLTNSYDTAGRLKERWTPAKGKTIFAYDASGNLTNVNYPASQDLTFLYERGLQLTTMIDAVGTTSFGYDTNGFLAYEDGPWAGDIVSYAYTNGLRKTMSLCSPTRCLGSSRTPTIPRAASNRSPAPQASSPTRKAPAGDILTGKRRMNDEELKKSFGSDYPRAMIVKGVRMSLSLETRFSRHYRTETPEKSGCTISRFMDGSAVMSFPDLCCGWVTWADDERIDFCQACVWLNQQADFRDMLRFIMQHGSSSHWRSVAISIASHLPATEAFPFLRNALRATETGERANLSQAIAITKHPEAEAVLREHLETAWRHPTLWMDDDACNPVAFDATTCIKHLIDLGAPPGDFEVHVRQLSQHVCLGIRHYCRTYLSRYYGWL